MWGTGSPFYVETFSKHPGLVVRCPNCFWFTSSLSKFIIFCLEEKGQFPFTAGWGRRSGAEGHEIVLPEKVLSTRTVYYEISDFFFYIWPKLNYCCFFKLTFKFNWKGCQRVRWLEASLTQWTWLWANSRRQWRTGKPGALKSMGSQRVVHEFVTEQ